jgi:hypothetical protein
VADSGTAVRQVRKLKFLQQRSDLVAVENAIFDRKPLFQNRR